MGQGGALHVDGLAMATQICVRESGGLDPGGRGGGEGSVVEPTERAQHGECLAVPAAAAPAAPAAAGLEGASQSQLQKLQQESS